MNKTAAHWLNPHWQYIPASSHVDATAFRQRQQERARQMQAKPKRRRDRSGTGVLTTA